MNAIAVDWSGAKKPKGKIWIAAAQDGVIRYLEPARSRAEAIEWVIAELAANRASVAGFDFAFSFPAWFLRECGLANAAELWELAARDGERWLEECASPFWGRPGKKRPAVQSFYRRTEQTAAACGSQPKSCFQIGGAGAVGTGSIRGMPYLMRFREKGIPVWPFDAAGLATVVEIYPRLLTGPVKKSVADERVRYLEEHWPALPAAVRARAAETEDAFDAAVSALVLDRDFHGGERRAHRDGIALLEGEIWAPPNTRAARSDSEVSMSVDRLLIPTAGPSDWRKLLADPRRQWVRGRSTFELAVS